jgi:hypothetical protein
LPAHNAKAWNQSGSGDPQEDAMKLQIPDKQPYQHLTSKHKDAGDKIDFDALKAVAFIAAIQVVLVVVIALTVHLLVTTDDTAPMLNAAADHSINR